MDAAGSDRATIYGWSEGGQLSIMLAATHPERVEGLVLYGTYASMKAPPWQVTPEQLARFVATLEKHWGEGLLVRLNAPSRVQDKAFVEWFGRLERAVASRSAIVDLFRANYEIDVGDLLPSIRVPTLVLHRLGDAVAPFDAGRALARAISDARFVELPGGDHLLQAFDRDVLETLIDEIEQFVTGRRPRRAPDAVAVASSGTLDDPRVSPDAGGASLGEAIAELERCREILASADEVQGLAGVVARAEAVAAAARGSWRESEAQFMKAAETFRRHGMVWQEAQTFQMWGHALQAGADRHAAIEKLDTALEIIAGSAPRPGGRDPVARFSSGDRAPSRAIFRREGDYWTLSWEGNVVRLKNAKGLHYIAYLLANPGRDVLAWELAAAGSAPATQRAPIGPTDRVAALGDAGEVLDMKARAQYRRRIGELREELAEAVRFNDELRATHLRAELESLGDQIVRAVGLGGRSRKAASQAERARLMVTKAIKAAIAKVGASDAALGRHFATSIKTGNCCAYDPGPRPPVAWQL